MKSVPTSFDFDNRALRPDYVVKCSYGNDSIALLQFLHEFNQKAPLGKVVVLYNNTGWAAKWWAARVENGEKMVRKMGFIPARTASIGMERLVMNHGGWPDELRKFCTEELKIIPTLNWLRVNDPEGAKRGNPQGIRQVIEWAKTVKPRKGDHYEADTGGCDSGYCTS